MLLPAILTVVFASTSVFGIPLPQGAGVGAGCNDILSDGDTGSGLAVKYAGQNLASALKSAGIKRQGAGVGAGCDAILTDGDTGSGLAVKEAGQNAAALLKSMGTRRQIDKAGAGVAAIVSDADPQLAAYQEGLTNSIDGYGTEDSATVGQQIGALEVQAGTGAGNLVPTKLPGAKRQIDKAGAGVAAIVGDYDPQAAEYQEGLTNTVDGYGTEDSATIGQHIGALEVEAGTGAGNLVPSKLPAANTNTPAP